MSFAGVRRTALAALVTAVLVAACQNTPRPAGTSDAATTATIGNTTVRMGGRVFVEGDYVE